MSGSYECTLSPELLEKAKKELKEKPEWRARDIQALRDMLKQHKGLTCPMDDAFLLWFLRARKFDYDRAYQLIINYYTIRAENTDVLKELTPSALKHVLTAGVSIMLPQPDKHGHSVMYFRPAQWDPAVFPIYDMLRMNIMNLELAIRQNEVVQVNGLVVIGNFAGMTWTHAKNLERNYAKLMTSVIQDAFPLRFKGMHAINEPSFISYVFAIIKPFMKEKMASRLNFHGSDLKGLQEALGKECLPEELGGCLSSHDILTKEWQKKVEGEAALFEELGRYKIELPRDIMDRKQPKEEAVDCLVGTYRKLNVD